MYHTINGTISVFGIGRDIRDVVEIRLHRVCRAKLIERFDHEVRITQPAVPIIPSSLGVRRFGYRCRKRRDDCAGLIEAAKFQGDGGPDHFGLPLQRHTQRSYPLEPVGLRPLEKLAPCLIRGGFERLVATKHQRNRLHESERRFLRNIRQRCVGGNSHRYIAMAIPDVVRSNRRAGRLSAVGERWPNPNRNARHTTQRLDAPEHLRGMEDALEPWESREEIGNANAIPCSVGADGFEYCGIPHVTGFDGRAIAQQDIAKAFFFFTGDQTAKNWIAIDARRAPPDNASGSIDQCRHSPIADGSQFQIDRRSGHSISPHQAGNSIAARPVGRCMLRVTACLATHIDGRQFI